MDLLDELFDLPKRPHAVVVVAMRGSRVLLCQGKKRQRTWCLPEIVLRESESPGEALERGFTEECGDVPRVFYEPFLKAYTQDSRPMWCYPCEISNDAPDAWDSPLGRCEFVEIVAAPQLYRLDGLRAFCKLMQALPSAGPLPMLNQGARGYLLHLVECERCRVYDVGMCDAGTDAFCAALGGGS